MTNYFPQLSEDIPSGTDLEEIRAQEWKEFCEKLAEQAPFFEGYNEHE